MGIFDRFRTSKPSMSARGASGRTQRSGFLQQDEQNVDLLFPNSLQVFDEMYRTDPDIRRNVLMVTNPIVGATWTVEPYGGDNAEAKDEEVADFVRWALFEYMNPNLKRHLAEALPVSLRSGFAPFEQVWTTTDYNGKQVLVPKTLGLRLPRTIQQFDAEDEELTQLVQFTVDKGRAELPAEDLVYYRFGAEGDNWEGISLLRSAYKPWLLKDKLERIDAIKQERLAVGVPICYPPDRATDEQRDEIAQILQGVRAAEAAFIISPGPHAENMQDGSQGWRFEILTTSQGEGNTGLDKSLAYHSDKIAASIMAEFMRLGQGVGASGARAVGDVQQNPFLQGIEAVASVVEDTLNDTLVGRMVALNYDVEGPPRLSMSLVDNTSLSELATYVQQLMNVGALHSDPALEEFLRDRADLPPEDPESIRLREEAAKAAAEAAITDPPPPPGPGTTRAEEAPAQDKGQPAGKPATKPKPTQLNTDPDGYVTLVAGTNPEPFSPSKTSNWVARAGGLPTLIQHVAHDLLESGSAHSESDAIAKAIGIVHNWAHGHDGHGHKVKPATVAEATKAIAEWDAKRAQAHAMHERTFARQDRPLKSWENVMALDAVESAIDGARAKFQAAGEPAVLSLAKQLASSKRKAPPKPPQELVDALHSEMQGLYRTGQTSVATELATQRGANPDPGKITLDQAADDKGLLQRAILAANSITQAIWQVISNLGMSDSVSAAQRQRAGEAEGRARLRAEAQLHAAGALNAGREAEAAAHADEIAGARYTSILDSNRCEQCASMDDDVLRPLDDPVLLAHKPPNPTCFGGGRCRCLLFYQLGDEAPSSA